ncbi:MAG: TolC family protein [Phycisphaerales bacterium JB063]
MNKTARALATATVASAALLPGCMHDPFADDPLTSDVVRDRLRSVQPVQLQDYAQPTELDAAGESPVVPAPAELEITLEQCRAWALEHNLDLQVAFVDPAIAQQQVVAEEARFEALFFGSISYADNESPTASNLEGGETTSASTNLGVRIPTRAGGSVTVDFTGSRFETDNQFSTLNPSFTSDMSISLSQNLLRNAGVRVNTAPIQIARLSAQQSNARTKLEVIRALTEVDRLYWRLYAAQQELLVRQQQHELAMAQLERAQRLVDEGDAADIEIMRAESGVADGLEAIIIAENQVRQRERALKRLLNVPELPMRGPTALIPLTPANPVAYDLPEASLLNDAMAGRLELLEIELALAQDALNIEVARNGVLPLAALEYRYTRNGLGDDFGDAFRQDYEENFDGHTLGLRFEVPLGNQAAKAALTRALLVRLQRLATREQREMQVRQEVLDAMDALGAAWQRVLASRQSAVLAARVLAAEQRQFDQGLNTSTDVQDAQTRLADAQSSEVRALVDYQIAQIDLAFATGTVLGSTQVRWEPAGLPGD